MTGLPFVYAFWAGRPNIVGPEDVRALQEARNLGLGATTDIGRECYPAEPARADRAGRYLRENVKYDLGEREAEGLRRFYELAAEIGAVESAGAPLFY
jgi:predicted solute-binding protein